MKYRRWVCIGCCVVLLVTGCTGLNWMNVRMAQNTGLTNGKTIVVDAGHGFFDAGKTGVHGIKEKDVNLNIAKMLRSNLEQEGYEVKMTRENDNSLYDGSSPKTKKEDMQKRIALMNDEDVWMSVSIHQNSFTEEKYKGAQVFYFSGSEKGQELAENVQSALIELVDSENTRQAKSNDDYYLLKKSAVPAIICECGFLSNMEEEEKLADQDYQEKIAWAITVGILRYEKSESGHKKKAVIWGDCLKKGEGIYYKRNLECFLFPVSIY